VYAGQPAGKAHLKSAGVDAADYGGKDLSPAGQALIVGPGAAPELAPHKEAIARFVREGGRVLAIGLAQEEADSVLPVKVTVRSAEHINAMFDAPGMRSPFAGVSPADVHNRDAGEMPLVSAGATVIGDGVLALAPAGAEPPGVVFCQLAPWRFDYRQAHHLKRTYRRASFTVTRLLANMGVAGSTPLLTRFATPTPDGDKRWLEGLYLDVPEEWDDPYRFFRW
jgi:hypothetical protein